MLQHIIAASQGDAHLVETETPGVFGVHTTSLGETVGYGELVLELVFDCSGSMSGAPIGILNERLPDFLKLVQRKLPINAKIKVNILSFSEKLRDVSSFDLTSESRIPVVHLETYSEGTDLSILGERIHNTSSTVRKLLVGFTDGEDGSGKLEESTEKIKQYVQGNQIAYAAFQYVGTHACNSHLYLTEIAQAAGGSFNTSANMSEFFNSATSKMGESLEPRRSFVFNFANLKVSLKPTVVWQPTSRAGVFATGQTVKQGDAINNVAVDITSRPVNVSSASKVAAGAGLSEKGPSVEDLMDRIAKLEAQLAAK